MPQPAVHRPRDGEFDIWSSAFFRSILERELDTAGFEAVVASRWRSGDFIGHAPATAVWLKRLAARPTADAGYACDAPHLGFRSRWLCGAPGQPGAIHIEAPGEQTPRDGLNRLNRPPHQHDSGRIALVTSGNAIFHVRRDDTPGRPTMLDCPVSTGDMICWPAWTPHTFDARQGFSLVSAMASYVAPGEDGFVYPVESDVERFPRRPYDRIGE